jgi:hypothetical protein
VTGYEDGLFHPLGNITREQMAVIMQRYAIHKDLPAAAGNGANAALYETFTDKAAVSAYAVDAMRWAVSHGIINGSEGALSPGATATRAQVAQIIYNFSTLTLSANAGEQTSDTI